MGGKMIEESRDGRVKWGEGYSGEKEAERR